MKAKYKFEPHTHTAESSACSGLPAKELVERYHEAGFRGLAITDHMYSYLVTRLKNDWNKAIDHLLKGYKKAKRRGDELGMDIILGMELRFDHFNGDFLVYGIDEKFLRANPFINRLSPRKFFKTYSNELLIIQAHPFRDYNEIASPNSFHGIEVYNSNPRHYNNNEDTMAFLATHPDLYPTSASDAHEAEDTALGWLELNRPVKDSLQFRDLIKEREYTLGKTV